MPFDTRQQKWLPLGLNPQTCGQDRATSRPELSKVYEAENQFRYLQPQFQPLLSSYDGKQVSCLNGLSSYIAAPEGAIKSVQKRFIIIDQSGNQTRLLQCGYPLRFPSSIAAEQGKKGFSKDHAISDKILLHEDGEESEMHEDTEEINALLYSDDDDCESDDDEVMSTGQSPFPVEQQACNKTTDETESSDDGPRHKRQKLLDHSYKDSSVGTKDLSYGKLPESNISSKQETGSGLSNEQSRKDKIHTALRILESVVPGTKGKEALLLLDEAIDYLKLLKKNYLNSHQRV